MNWYNEDMVQELIKTFGIEKTYTFCKLYAHLFKMEHKDAFDEAFYEHKWWKDRAEELLKQINTRPKT